MKTLVRGTLFTGALMIGASGSIAAQSSEEWHKAKFGRPSAREEARLKAERESTAYREETRHIAKPAESSRHEEWHKVKFGRPSAKEEARLKAERESTAYREDKSRETAKPAKNDLSERWYQMKFGRKSATGK